MYMNFSRPICRICVIVKHGHSTCSSTKYSRTHGASSSLNRLAPNSALTPSRRDFVSSKANVPFSQTPAFSQRKSGGYGSEYSSSTPIYVADYYDSARFQLIRLFSVLGSVAAVIVYVTVFRERNDIDEILDAPPALLAANMQRATLRHQIKQRRAAGENTKLLEAELAYTDVREAALRSQYQQSGANKRMYVPDHIYVSGSNGVKRRSRSSTSTPEMLSMPDRITLAGNGKFIETRRGPVKDLIHQQLDSITVSEPCTVPSVITASLISQHETPSITSLDNALGGASTSVEENPISELKLMRRRIGQINSRIIDLEEEAARRKTRELSLWALLGSTIIGVLMIIFRRR